MDQLRTLLYYISTNEVVFPLLAGVIVFGAIFAVGRLLHRKPQGRTLSPLVYSDAKLRPDPFDHGPTGDHRTAVRRKGSVVRVVLADAKLKAIGEGWVIDRSTGGLGLYCDEPLAIGTEISVRPEDAQNTSPWVKVVVRSQQKEDEHWKLGCQFLRTPPWSVLLLFG